MCSYANPHPTQHQIKIEERKIETERERNQQTSFGLEASCCSAANKCGTAPTRRRYSFDCTMLATVETAYRTAACDARHGEMCDTAGDVREREGERNREKERNERQEVQNTRGETGQHRPGGSIQTEILTTGREDIRFSAKPTMPRPLPTQAIPSSPHVVTAHSGSSYADSQSPALQAPAHVTFRHTYTGPSSLLARLVTRPAQA
jgi:hypothetical protein